MGFADQYLNKQRDFSPCFIDIPSEKLGFTVVIPAYCEPDITNTLESLWNCDRPHVHVEVIVVVNSPEHASSEVFNCNKTSIATINKWIQGHVDPSLRFLLIEMLNMPVNTAGVGLARKIGMDEALVRFNRINNSNGFIVSFDADSLCDPNYFMAIEESLTRHTAVNGFDIYFEHPVSGSDFSEDVYRGIVAYELHQRYVNQFLRFSGFPFAFHTVGSCFGVRADIYARQGGMNKRKAGEDFYFLHKIIPLGQFIEINATRIIPSPRESDRVPFGTGTAITRYLAASEDSILTYAPQGFLALHEFFRQIEKFFKLKDYEITAIINLLPVSLKNFLIEMNAVTSISEINANCSSVSTFINRFFRWFDAFRVIKYLNYASRCYFEKVPVHEAVIQYLQIAGIQNTPSTTGNYDLLMLLRGIERGGEKVKR